MPALRRRFELLAVKLAGIDLVIIDRFERGGVAAGIDSFDVLVRIDPGFAQAISREQVSRGGRRIGEANEWPRTSATVLMPDDG